MATEAFLMRGVMVRLNILTLPLCTSDIGGSYDRNANVGCRPISDLIPLALLDIWLYNRCRMAQRLSDRTICSGAA